MKKSLHRVAISLVLCTLLGSAALAGGKSKQVTFTQDIKVGDTLVKKGDYVVTFDEKTNELTVRRGSKVVAKAAGRLEEQKSAYPVNYLTAKDKESNLTLSGVQLGGRLVVVGGETAAGATSIAPASPQN
ncbi:MAG TPA: hypothetical protein VGX24_06520 [Pyrinomonadaceae bacterium]|jgi:hypothetical protein|nr:hypothetical protein [Pyrinomonadaceae bacterium]